MKEIIATTEAPAAIGPYSQAVEANGMVFVSGQIPLNPATGEVQGEDVREQTTQVFKNIQAILQEAGLNLNNVLKTTVLLADMSDFAAMNEVYAAHFAKPFPARSAFAVKTLPKNVRIEIEVIAAR
ncbi:MAG: RidA family protein [Prevotella sp.]|jgi:2-iminobutanoate/2-iminopropanoate deaminase|nr:RidA family protein [Prevotella sp.]